MQLTCFKLSLEAFSILSKKSPILDLQFFVRFFETYMWGSFRKFSVTFSGEHLPLVRKSFQFSRCFEPAISKKKYDFWEFTSERDNPNLYGFFPDENWTCFPRNLKNLNSSSSKWQNGSKNKFSPKKKAQNLILLFFSMTGSK